MLEITEVKVRIVDHPKVAAFVNVVICDGLRLQNLRIIKLDQRLMLAMPSQKVCDHCTCGMKTPLNARYCSSCGAKLAEDRVPQRLSHANMLFANVVYPINHKTRQYMETVIFEAYLHALNNDPQPTDAANDLEDEDTEASPVHIYSH